MTRPPAYLLTPVLAAALVVCPESAPLFGTPLQGGLVATDRALTGLLAGYVMDATTGARLNNATVWLSLAPRRTTAIPQPRFETQRVLVDREGAFVFSRLPAGTYALRAERRGYAEGALGRREPSGLSTTLDLRDGELKTDIALGLWKHAAIEGRITDELGDPIARIAVAALRRRTIAGHSQLTRAQSASTDDRGVFRIVSLEPGEYVVFVPSPRTTAPGYQAMFYPAASTPAASTMLALRPGEDRSDIDLQLRVTSQVRVGGALRGPDGPMAQTSVRLVPGFAAEFAGDAAGATVATAITDAQGAFVLTSVPPGEYEIKVESTVSPPLPSPSSFVLREPPKVFWASQQIGVGSTDIANVRVAVRPGVRVSGRLEFVGGTAVPTAAQTTRAWVWLLPATNGTLNGVGMSGRADIDATGRFTTEPVTGGKYVIRVSAIGRWTMASATLDGRDVADGPIDLSAGDVSDVVVRMTDRQTTLSGGVLDARGGPDADACVLIFPSDPSLWLDGSVQPRRLRMTRTDDAGTFAIDGAPSGEYFAVAVSAATAGDWNDPRALDLLSRLATRIRLADGERRTVTLRTVSRPPVARGGNE